MDYSYPWILIYVSFQHVHIFCISLEKNGFGIGAKTNRVQMYLWLGSKVTTVWQIFIAL